MKQYLLVLMCFAVSALQGQFQMPKNVDGSPLVCEKFEMLEHFFNQQNSNIEEKEGTNPITLRASGEVKVGDSNKTESELHAIVNPSDPNNIIVGVMDFEPNSFTDPLNMSIYVTYDFGDTWQKSSFNGNIPDRLTGGGGDPMFAFDAEGNLFFSWLRIDLDMAQVDPASWGIYMAKSEDGGLTWESLNDPIEKFEFSDLVFLSDLEVAPDKEWMASDLSPESPHYGNVYISYVNLVLENLATTGATYEITFKRKLPGHSEFDSIGTIISRTDHVIAQFANIEVDNDGTIFIVYLANEVLEVEDVQSMYFVKSEDGGLTFTEPVKFVEYIFPDFGSGRLPIPGVSPQRLYPCPQLAIDRSKGENEGRLYHTFTAYDIDSLVSISADIYLMYSDDQGDTWSEPFVVNDDQDSIAHQYYPSITVNDEGMLGLAWYDRRNDNGFGSMTDYYLGFSRDGAEEINQFQVNAQSSDFASIGIRNNDFGIGEYNEIVHSGNYFIPFWADGRTNDGTIAVYAYFFDQSTGTLEKKVPLNSNISLNSIGPNPSSGTIHLELDLKASTRVNFEFVNTQGQSLIVEDVGTLPAGVNAITLKQDLPPGIYYLNVNSEFPTITQKIIMN